jgi:hypothetical protein
MLTEDAKKLKAKVEMRKPAPGIINPGVEEKKTKTESKKVVVTDRGQGQDGKK